MQNFIEFQKLRAKRAWRDGVAFARKHLPGSVFALLASLVGLPLVQSTGANVTEEATLLVLYSFLGPIAVIGVVFFLFWLRAPAVIHKEMQNQIGTLQSGLSHKQDKQFIAHGLTIILEIGNVILRERIKDSEYDGWDKQRAAWNAGAQVFIAQQVSYQDAVNFLHIQTLGKTEYAYKISDAHNKHLGYLNVSLGKVKGMLDNYREHWKIITVEEKAAIAALIFPDVNPNDDNRSPEDTEEKTQP